MEKVEKVENLKNKNWYCEICNYYAKRSDLYKKHLSTDKHKRKVLSIEKVEKVEKVEKLEKVDKKVEDQELKFYECSICNKQYKCNSGLWRHKKTCIPIEKTQIVEKTEGSNDYKDMILELVKENKEMRNMMVEQQKTIGELIPKVGNNNSTTNNNTINQKFNINVFLNEQCKDAINMSDFIKQIEISLEQLDFTKTNGLEKGLTHAIMENMNKLSVFERPMHCTDVKRETLYIKDNDTWEKDKDKSKIKQVIKKASNKNYTALTNWRKENPDFMEDDDKQMFYAKAMSKLGKPLDGIDDKVIKHLCNNTKIKEIKDE